MLDYKQLDAMVHLYADYVVAYGHACTAGLNYADSDDWEQPLVEPYKKEGEDYHPLTKKWMELIAPPWQFMISITLSPTNCGDM